MVKVFEMKLAIKVSMASVSIAFKHFFFAPFWVIPLHFQSVAS